MQRYHIDDMTKGWFVGDFAPSVLRTNNFEVALHRHLEGDPTEPHYHKLAPEINVIIRGRMIVNGEELAAGDIFVFQPDEVSRAEFLADTDLIVVKTPSVPDDKYLVE